MKDLVSKLLPLVEKLKGKKPVVIILSALVIGVALFAVQKGLLQEDAISFDVIINFFDSTFKTAPVDTLAAPVDSLKVLDTAAVIAGS